MRVLSVVLAAVAGLALAASLLQADDIFQEQRRAMVDHDIRGRGVRDLQAAIGAGIPDHVPYYTVNKLCGADWHRSASAGVRGSR